MGFLQISRVQIGFFLVFLVGKMTSWPSLIGVGGRVEVGGDCFFSAGGRSTWERYWVLGSLLDSAAGRKKNGIFLGSFGPDSDPLQGDWFARKMMMSDVVSIVLRLSIQLCLAAAGDPRGLPALR